MIRNAFLVLAVLGLQIFTMQNTMGQNSNAPDTSSSALKQALIDSRYTIDIDDGSFSGAGWDMLVKRAREAELVTLGESHGTKEIPKMMRKLIGELQQTGDFSRLAIEVSPWTANQLENHIERGEGAYNAFVEQYPRAFPFYNWESERELLEQAVEGEAQGALVGMDQIFTFSTSMVFDRLVTLAPSEKAKQKVKEIESQLHRKAKGKPELKKLPSEMSPPITLLEDGDMDSLEELFTENGEAKTLLEEVRESIRIYDLMDRNNYQSNQLRAQLLRENLVKAVKPLSKENVSGLVIKTGAMHAYRDRTPNNALDIGNLAVSLADLTGGEAFNVAIICGPESTARVFPAGRSGCWHRLLGDAMKEVSSEKPALYDLSQLHPKMHKGAFSMSDALEQFLWAFDAVIIIPNASPAEYIAPVR